MEQQSSILNQRVYYIDWLRVLAVLLLVPFHSALIFSLDPNNIVYVKDQVESTFLFCCAGFVHQWHMPLLFVISGMGSWFALCFRSGGQYVRERVMRLGVPLAFGLVVLVPPMVYLYRLSQQSVGSFWSFYPQAFRINMGDLSGRSGSFTPGHLWFILFLLVYSLLALPLFLWLKSERGRPLIGRLAALMEKPGRIYLIALVMALSVLVLDLGGMPLLMYFMLFVCGYLFMADERFMNTIRKHMVLALIIGTIAAAVILFVELNLDILEMDWWMSLLVHVVYYISRWSWVVAILGLGQRFLDKPSKLLRYLSSASYPIYLIHFLVNTAVGMVVVQWDAGIAFKYVVINLATFGICFVIYEVIRRFNVLRFLFGMKVRRKVNT